MLLSEALHCCDEEKGSWNQTPLGQSIFPARVVLNGVDDTWKISIWRLWWHRVNSLQIPRSTHVVGETLQLQRKICCVVPRFGSRWVLFRKRPFGLRRVYTVENMPCIKVQIAVGGIAYHKTSQQFTTYHTIPSQPDVFQSGSIFVHPINNFAGSSN